MFLSYLSNIFSLSKRKFLYCIVYLSLLLLFCFFKKKVGHCNSEDGKVESNVAKGRGKGKYQVKHRFFLYIILFLSKIPFNILLFTGLCSFNIWLCPKISRIVRRWWSGHQCSKGWWKRWVTYLKMFLFMTNWSFSFSKLLLFLS